MNFGSWRKKISRKACSGFQSRWSSQPNFETLEDRTVPSAVAVGAMSQNLPLNTRPPSVSHARLAPAPNLADSSWVTAAEADVQGSVPGSKNGPLANVGLDLALVYEEARAVGRDGALTAPRSLMQVSGNEVMIDTVARGDTATLEAGLERLGMQINGVYGQVVSGWIPATAIAQVASLGNLAFALPAYRPYINAGSVTSEGDHAVGSDLVHDTSVDGTGVTVGILSDSYNNQDGAALDILSGDLPASGVDVLQDLPVQDDGTDEGRAMLQIVHDVAPGASLAFHTASISEPNFAQGIVDLANAGAQIIADDELYFDEPMFQDGIVAQAVDSVTATGHTYFSAAGNESNDAYESPFVASGTDLAPGSIPSAPGAPYLFGGQAHNFSNGNIYQNFTIPSFDEVTFDFQWNSDYASAGPGNTGSANDLDIYLVDATTHQIVAGSNNDNMGADPTEIFNYDNESNDTNYQVLIVNYAGPNPTDMKYVYFDYGGEGAGPTNFVTNSGTIFGHANAAGAEAVGAAAYYETPAFGVNPAVLEPFSSSGPTPVYFSANGTPINDLRMKPELVGPDGVSTTLVDSFGLDPFYGTSAATPHAAAVAALMLSADPSLTPAQVGTILQDTASPMPGGPGFNFDSGYGFIRADKAVESVLAKVTPLVVPVTSFASQDQEFSGPVARFADSGTPVAATIYWGDGQTSSGQLVANGDGTYTVSGTHTYAIEESGLGLAVKVLNSTGKILTVSNQMAGNVTAQFSAADQNTVFHFNNLSAFDMTNVTLTGIGATGAIEGESNAILLPSVPAGTSEEYDFDNSWPVFSTDFPESFAGSVEYLLTANWNGVTVSSFFSPHANATGKFIGFLGNDAYDNAKGKPTASVRVGFIGTLQMNVLDSSPLAYSTPTTYTVSGGESTGNIIAATFQPVDGDMNLADYSASINWGDGSGDTGNLGLSGSNITVSGSHTYSDAAYSPYSLYVILQHNGGGFTSADNTTVVVTSPPIVLTPVATTWPAHVLFTGALTTISDPDLLADPSVIQVAIQWGDKSTTDTTSGYAVGTGGEFTIYGSHDYANAPVGATYNVEVTATYPVYSNPSLGSTASTNLTLKLGYPPLVLSPAAVITQEGQILTDQTVATFTDPLPNDPPNYSADIDWGDGSAKTIGAQIAEDPSTGIFSVLGSHQYAQYGSYGIIVTVHHSTAADVMVTTPAIVNDAPLQATPVALKVVQNADVKRVVVAKFMDANPLAVPADFQATINWGSSQITKGTIVVDPNGGFDVLGTKPTPYAMPGSASISVRIVDTDGGTGATVLSSFWVATTALTTDAEDAGAATGPGGQIYVVGGYSDAAGYLSSTQVYDPATATWNSAASLPTPRVAEDVVADGGLIYSIGGFDPTLDGPTSEVDVYDPSADAWTQLSPLPTALYAGAAAVGTDGNIYVFGGVDNNFDVLSSAFVYNPALDSWTALPDMPTPRYFLSAALGGDGNLYALGGFDSVSESLSTVEGFNTTTQAWFAAAPMPTARAALAAVELTDGRIAAMGGYAADSQTELDTVELFNPRAKSWTAGPSLPDPVSDLTAAVGADGLLYTIGGYDPILMTTTSAVNLLPVITPSTASLANTVTIAEAPIVATKPEPRLSAFQGMSTGNVVVATFVDQAGGMPAGSYSATIAWGDGATSAGSVSVSGNNLSIAGSHTYALGGLEHAQVTIVQGTRTTVASITVDVATDETGYATVTSSPLTLNSSDGLYDGSITITNSSKGTLSGAFLLALKGLTKGVTLSSVTITINGVTTTLAITQDPAGAPVIIIPRSLVAKILKGKSITLNVEFSSPSANVSYNPDVFSDPNAS